MTESGWTTRRRKLAENVEVQTDLNADDVFNVLIALEERGHDGIQTFKDLIARFENELEQESQQRMARHSEERYGIGDA